jgi:hypothetical protein
MLDYNMMFEMWMDLQGSAQEEFKMFYENSRRAPVAPGGTDINFVKPPMVDREGIIMCSNNLNTFGSASGHLERNQGAYLKNCNTFSDIKQGLPASITFFSVESIIIDFLQRQVVQLQQLLKKMF